MTANQEAIELRDSLEIDALLRVIAAAGAGETWCPEEVGDPFTADGRYDWFSDLDPDVDLERLYERVPETIGVVALPEPPDLEVRASFSIIPQVPGLFQDGVLRGSDTVYYASQTAQWVVREGDSREINIGDFLLRNGMPYTPAYMQISVLERRRRRGLLFRTIDIMRSNVTGAQSVDSENNVDDLTLLNPRFSDGGLGQLAQFRDTDIWHYDVWSTSSDFIASVGNPVLNITHIASGVIAELALEEWGFQGGPLGTGRSAVVGRVVGHVLIDAYDFPATPGGDFIFYSVRITLVAGD